MALYGLELEDALMSLRMPSGLSRPYIRVLNTIPALGTMGLTWPTI